MRSKMKEHGFRGLRRLIWPLALALAALPLHGATAPAPGTGTTGATAPQVKPGASGAASPAPVCSAAQAKVTSAYREVPTKSGTPTKGADVSLGEVLTLDVAELPSLLACGKPLVLFLDDRPLKDLTPYPPTDSQGGKIRFLLHRPLATAADASASREVWTYLFGSPAWGNRQTKVSLGFADGAAVPTAASIGLVVIPQRPFYLWLTVLAIVAVVFWSLAIQSNLLRDPGATPGPGKRLPYSLSRTQAAWWFFIVLASYLFIGLVTADFSTQITGTVLILLGISAGTLVGSAFIDQSKVNPATAAEAARVEQTLQNQVASLQGAVANAQQTLAQPPVQSPLAQAAPAQAVQGAAQAKLDLLTLSSALKEKESLLKKTRSESEQFLLDILSDANGVTFHRFQIVAWTFVLGIIFIHEVYKGLAMPTFDGSLLALMGISSGTFLGMKVPEATVPKT
jgi:hypothetical protein